MKKNRQDKIGKKRRARRHRATRRIAELELKIAELRMGVKGEHMTEVHRHWIINLHEVRRQKQMRKLEQNK